MLPTIAPQPSPAQDTEAPTLLMLRRQAIEEIATTRAKVIRCGLFGNYIFRPNPLRQEDDVQRSRWRDQMQEQLAGLDRALALLNGDNLDAAYPQEICDWIARCGRRCPAESRILRDMQRLTGTLVDKAAPKDPTFEQLLQQHATFGRETFFPAISVLCDTFWADLDHQRDREVARAQEAGKTIAHTLGRLANIGRHVRLVSINASVEAARVGDEGKAMGVVAQEFKALAEEIQQLSNSARDNIDGLAPREN